MSDSSQRRGTDLNSLRSAGAGTGRLPREAEDPLAELARLVSQGEPPRPRNADMPPAYAPPRAPEARVEPRADYTPPPVEPRVPDRLDPLGGGDFRAEPRSASHARSYGATTAQPDYDPDDDFFADNPPPLRGSQGYNTYQDDEFETTYDAAFQARQPYGDDDFDDGVSSVYPADDDLSEDHAPVRRRGGMLTMGALMSVGLVAGFGAWAYFSLGGSGGADGAPPVIEAKTDTPMKVVAEAKPIEKSKKDYDRIPVNADSSIGPAPEEPGEKPRVIIPNQSASAGSDDRVPASTASVARDTAPSDPVGSVPTSDSGMRVVKTIPISAASLSGASEPTQAATASELPPPIQGSGVAEGMSLQPGKDYSIVTSQPEAPVPAAPPAAAASSQPSQMAFASEQVPLPQPRPLLPQVSPAPQAPAAATSQARAATPVQAPTAGGGPPSSPQPQVTVTNKRALQPQGAPPPARSSQRTTAPAAPRQVAMAGSSPPPVAAAPAAQVAAAPAPVQSAPQVAAVSSSSGAFGVQLTAQRSQEEALAAFNALKQRHPQVLGPYTATVARADLGDRGVFYRALVPAQSQADASNLCIQFKSAGVDCIVQRR